MDREALDTIRSLLEGGDTASAVAAMLDTLGGEEGVVKVFQVK